MQRVQGIATAAVGTMCARVGEAMSTWNDGIISCMNDVAGSRGVLPGMGVREAAGKMLISWDKRSKNHRGNNIWSRSKRSRPRMIVDWVLVQ
jgi:hypothetical protein